MSEPVESTARGGAPEPAGPAAEPVASFPRLRKLDAAWYRVEQLVCAAMFLFMALIVFVAVVRDVFVSHTDAGHIVPDLLILWGIAFAALTTRVRMAHEKERRLHHAALRNAGLATIATVVIAGLVWLYLEFLPGGFNWAPKMALCLMLWVAFLGASMATFDKAHLALEFGDKIWPKALLRWIKAFAHALTTAFCAVLFVLGVMSLIGHYDQWTAAGGEGATVATLDWLPEWAVYVIFPYVFLAMTIRFLAQTVTTATGTDITPERGPS